MKILLVVGSFPPMLCGVGDYTRSLARALTTIPGVHVAVLTSAEAEGGGRAGEPFEVFPAVRRWELSEIAAVRRVIREWQPDVIHVQYPSRGYSGPLSWLLPMLLLAERPPVVQTWHEYVPGARTALWHLAIGVAPGDVVVVRPEFRERMPWWYRALTGRREFHLVPNAPTLPRVELSDAERAEIRGRYAPPDRRLLAYFGFLYANKGIDDLLGIVDPERHHLVVVGELQRADPFQVALAERIARPPLAGHVTLAGFLEAPEAARVLAAVDAVVLPFRDGGGEWNTSLKAAAAQGTFVLTTSTRRSGYVAAQHVYYARPGDRGELRAALDRHVGSRIASPAPELAGPSWGEIARAHVAIYERRIGR
ncbi:MAG TPA: glycosyltransferase [Anaeromyxobacter sp.]